MSELGLPQQIAQASTTSIFQISLDVIDKLNEIPDFDIYMKDAEDHFNQNKDLTNVAMGFNPVDLLMYIFKRGDSLCQLYNILSPEEKITIKETKDTKAASAIKANVYHFLLSLKFKLDFSEDDLFSIAELFKDDTNSFVKIIKTVSKLLEKIEGQGLNIPNRKPSVKVALEKAKDNRSKVVMEMLETERKYINDLELLQEFMNECSNTKCISLETIRFLFANLNALLDFQRRFLIGIEGNALLPAQDQRFGALFISMEEKFEVYEPFCANYNKASELAAKEAENMQGLAHIIEPVFQLPSYLIKPIQRICKYPLLLRELLKATKKEEYPHFEELELGMKAIERIAGKVNETKRKEENVFLKEELRTRIINWDKLNIDDFGELLQHDKFIVVGKDQKEREMNLFLFETIIICCKELSPTSKKAKPSSFKSGNALELRGQILIKNVVKVADRVTDTEVFMRLYWRTEEVQILVLKCRNEEQIKLWKPTIDKLMPKKPVNHTANAEMSRMSSTHENSMVKNVRDSETGRSRSASTPDIGLPKGYPIPSLKTDFNFERFPGLPANTEALLLIEQIKVKIHYLEDVFLILCPISLDLEELMERIDKKIKICNPSHEKTDYRIKYRDEDGDCISVTSDEDVRIAFDSARLNQIKFVNPTAHVLGGAVVNLFVE